MSFLKNLFGKKDPPIRSYADFWNWFTEHQATFYGIVKNKGDIRHQFFGKLTPKLEELRDGYFFLTGMKDEQTAELVFTAEGKIKNMVFIEELVAEAPALERWNFLALKQAMDMSDLVIGIRDMQISTKNLHFYATEHDDHPDLIEITIVQDDLTEENRDLIHHATYIFLDNALGELHFATSIDVLNILSPAEAKAELVPITKLKEYLSYRQKEFIEKYEGTWCNIEEDSYSLLETTLDNDLPVIAVINTDLLKWDRKASHPWLLEIEFDFSESANNGMPDQSTQDLMDTIEEQINAALKDREGFLNIGRQTGEGKRCIFFACKDFRQASKVLDQLVRQYEDELEIDFDIYKDKYWQSLASFEKGAM
ncbi:MAG: DUF695 domain-containing protein [Bacteroidota bacterium]